jgi:hypothetical protein
MKKARHIAAATLVALSFGIGNGPQALPTSPITAQAQVVATATSN